MLLEQIYKKERNVSVRLETISELSGQINKSFLNLKKI